MWSNNIVTIGEKVEIVLNFNSHREKTYFSMIQDILDGDTMIINLPMSKGEVAFLHMEQEIAVNYFRCHGQYYFIATVIERYEKENSHFFKIKKVSETHRLQRRNYYRLAKTMPVRIDLLDKEDEGSTKTIHGHTCNICGGGLGIIIRQEIPVDTRVKCIFKLKDNENIEKMETKGRVVRCDPLTDRDEGFEVGICFEDMPEGQRDEIVKFIFSEQRRLRRKGLI